MRPIIILMALVAGQAAACERVLFGGWSHHASNHYDYNSSHDLIGVYCRGWSLIRFKNSYYQESYGLGYELMPYRLAGVQIGAYVGAWTGYDHKAPVVSAAGLRFRYPIGRLAVVGTTAYRVTAVHLEWSF